MPFGFLPKGVSAAHVPAQRADFVQAARPRAHAAMPKKERAAKNAAIAMAKELDSEMTEEERERKEKAGMGVFGGLNKGEDELFAKKATKEEKKAAAEAKRAEMAAKKAAKKAAEGGDEEGDDADMTRVESAVSVCDIGDPEYADNYADEKGKDAKKGKKGAEAEAEDTAESGGSLQKLDEGTLKFAVCTGNLASRKDSRDVKVQVRGRR